MKYFSTKQIQGEYCQKRESGGENRPAQRLVNASIHDFREALSPHQFYIFSDAVKHHNGVVHGVADQS